MRRTFALATCAAAILAVAGLTGCGSTSSSAAPDSGFVAGDGSIVVVAPDKRAAAPDITGTTLDGSAFRLADHRGEVVVMNVWASWCAPCRAEAPDLAAVARQFADKGVTFVGIDTRDSTPTAQSFITRFGIPYPSIVDTDGRVQLQFGSTLPPQAIPSTVVIDQQGRVAARVLGRADAATLRGIIEPLLAEGGTSSPAASSSASAS